MSLCFNVDESMYKDQYSYCPCFRCLLQNKFVTENEKIAHV